MGLTGTLKIEPVGPSSFRTPGSVRVRGLRSCSDSERGMGDRLI